MSEAMKTLSMEEVLCALRVHCSPGIICPLFNLKINLPQFKKKPHHVYQEKH